MAANSKKGTYIPPPLHELEAEVMEEVWRQDKDQGITVRQVLEALNMGSKKRAYTTVMTVMARLRTKGLLTRERKGKTYLYVPVLGRKDYLDVRAQAQAGALVVEFGDLALAHFAKQV